MPINVGSNLQTVGPAAIPVSPTGNYEGTQAAVQGVAVAGKAFLQSRQTKVLGDIAGEAQSIVSEASGYQSAKDAIVEKLAQSDKASFDNISRQLQKLRNGEIQGILSPGAANMRLQSLAKSYINRYPRLAGPIRQMLATVSGDITPETETSKISDPILQARYKLVEDAEEAGVSTEEMLISRRAQYNRDLHKANLEDAQITSQKDLPRLMWNLVDSQSVETFGQLSSGMVNRIKRGQFLKENELTGLRTAMSAGLAKLNSEVTKYEVENGLQVDHKVFEDRFKSAFEPLIALATEADTPEKQRRLSVAYDTILKNGEYRQLHDTFQSLTPLIVQSPDQMFRIMAKQTEMIDQIQSGNLPTVEMKAKYRPEELLLLQSLKNNPVRWNEIMAGVAEGVQGKKPKSTGSAALDNLRAAIIVQSAADPGTPKEDAAKLLANYIYAGEPTQGIIMNKRLHEVLRQSPDAQKALENQVQQHLVEVVESTPLSVLKAVKFDFSNPKEPMFTGPMKTTFKSSHGDQFGFQAQQEVVRDLNGYIGAMLIYKDQATTKTDVEAQFQSLLKNRMDQDGALLEQAKADEQAAVDGEAVQAAKDKKRQQTKIKAAGAAPAKAE